MHNFSRTDEGITQGLRVRFGLAVGGLREQLEQEGVDTTEIVAALTPVMDALHAPDWHHPQRRDSEQVAIREATKATVALHEKVSRRLSDVGVSAFELLSRSLRELRDYAAG